MPHAADLEDDGIPDYVEDVRSLVHKMSATGAAAS
jgi:hypothetical protein